MLTIDTRLGLGLIDVLPEATMVLLPTQDFQHTAQILLSLILPTNIGSVMVTAPKGRLPCGMGIESGAGWYRGKLIHFSFHFLGTYA